VGKIGWMGLLFLTGCGYGMEVKYGGEVVQHNPDGGVRVREIFWYCYRIKPVFYFDERVAVCGTKEECTRICLELRKEDK